MILKGFNVREENGGGEGEVKCVCEETGNGKERLGERVFRVGFSGVRRGIFSVAVGVFGVLFCIVCVVL